MSSAFRVTTPPTTEPITLQDAKDYMRIDFSDDDTQISNLITRARKHAETVTHRALATQSIRCIYTIERPTGGELSGPVNEGPNWYQYQEQLGANPFGAAQFYFDLPQPPFDTTQPFTVQTRTTVFDTWQTFTGLYTIDDTQEPARVYFQDPVTANQWQFTYTCGNSAATYAIDDSIKQCLFELVTYWYDNRDGASLADIENKLLMHRVDWI